MLKLSKFSKALLLSIIYILFFNVILFFYKAPADNDILIKFIMELAILLPTSIITFYVVLLNTRLISSIIFALLFAIGAINNYFYFYFNKVFDTGVLIDLLTVQSDLIRDFISYQAIIFMLVATIFGFILSFKITTRKCKSVYFEFIRILSLILVISISSNWNFRTFNPTIINYLPFNIFYSIYEYNKKFKLHISKLDQKIDLTKKHSFNIENIDDSEPITVVLIIGESMRGDLLSINGYDLRDNTPLLRSRSDLISFTNAKSSTTSTRGSLPYILTSAVVPNFQQALSEKSIISIFKSLGFTTSWIGNQGIFGTFETTYASSALEADHLLIRKDFTKMIPDRTVYDTDMLPAINARLNMEKGNQLIVLHMFGSHWIFYNGYPRDMENKFMPECMDNIISRCNKEKLLNGYSNTIKYSDYFLNEVIKLLENKNSFMIYASDHGYSLGENGNYANAYSKDDNIPKEQLNIGMFFWGSKKFYNKNPDLFNLINNKKHNPINHDFIFHSLLDCAKVKSSYINKGLSVCAPKNEENYD